MDKLEVLKKTVIDLYILTALLLAEKLAASVLWLNSNNENTKTVIHIIEINKRSL